MGLEMRRRLRVVNRTATRIQDRNGVRLSAALGTGVAWVEGAEFRSGTIEVDIRGRESMEQITSACLPSQE